MVAVKIFCPAARSRPLRSVASASDSCALLRTPMAKSFRAAACSSLSDLEGGAILGLFKAMLGYLRRCESYLKAFLKAI